ncbi:uncharacterized protein LOC117810445 isoform X2 [Notolabrus celidotus]|uniref:uncharacterized protein LOC117810445 isoform X2 n=1 Tax=Notolabrus celidotus TaxID=1203425 RepID=UPI00148F572D|nr:uncharacterized protein LOC117810445 isoform X2 [Notolabrus celidotus]
MSNQQKPEYSHIESAARNLLTLLQSVSPGQGHVPAQNQNANQVLNQGQTHSQEPSQEPRGRQANVQQEMAKSFPGLFRRDRISGKRRFPTPLRHVSAPTTKTINVQFYLLPRPMTRTPDGSHELKLLMAGLGKRLIALQEHSNHVEITTALLAEYPKMGTLSGGWLFYKASGGSGQRKLAVIPPESEGYNAKLLKSTSNNGRHTIFIVPLQDEIDTVPLLADAPEFSKMPKSQCKTCGEILPLQALALHLDSCSKSSDHTEQESDEGATDQHEEDLSLISSGHTSPVNPEKICPVCQQEYPADCIEMHASSCGDRQYPLEEPVSDSSGAGIEVIDGPSCSYSQVTPLENPPSSSAAPSDTAKKDDWKTMPTPSRAAWFYREAMLQNHASGKPLRLHFDLGDSNSDQDLAFIAFYKACKVDWASPLQWRLEGDPAIGEGVSRFLFSRVMQKLKDGFTFNFGNSCVTRLFDGEVDHLVPSSSAFLVESDLFLMAGRMIGHCFLHGGPSMSGLSPAVVHILCGGTVETATIEISDCPDIDLREIIQLVEGTSELTADEKERVNTLCLAWDFPVMTNKNRRWLFERLLHHAVIGRVTRQIKQIRKGLKETMVWPLISGRPDVVPILFPNESSAVLTPERILDCISWPTMIRDDKEEEDDDECSVEDKSRITGYLRQFIQNASSEELKILVKFWIGWEAPTSGLAVEVIHSSLPKSSTCFETLRLPAHYKDYQTFKRDLIASINTADTGFGLV